MGSKRGLVISERVAHRAGAPCVLGDLRSGSSRRWLRDQWNRERGLCRLLSSVTATGKVVPGRPVCSTVCIHPVAPKELPGRPGVVLQTRSLTVPSPTMTPEGDNPRGMPGDVRGYVNGRIAVATRRTPGQGTGGGCIPSRRRSALSKRASLHRGGSDLEVVSVKDSKHRIAVEALQTLRRLAGMSRAVTSKSNRGCALNG